MNNTGIEHLVFSKDAPLIKGHYSHMTKTSSGVFYVAGQKSWDPATGEIVGDNIAAQTLLIFSNIRKILAADSLNFNNLTRIQCHLGNIEHYESFNAAYSETLGTIKPVRTVLGGYTLRDNALVELVVEGFNPTVK